MKKAVIKSSVINHLSSDRKGSESSDRPKPFTTHPLMVPSRAESPKNVMVIDIGGSHVKLVTNLEREPRKFVSGPDMTAAEMAAGVKKLASNLHYDAISIGYPGSVLRGRPIAEPYELGKGWVSFDFESTFQRPVKLLNDAAMQAIGSYRGGKMLFLGLGTGLGSTMIVDGIVEPMEIGHLPYKKHTYEDYLGKRGLKRLGKKRWREEFKQIVDRLMAAMEPDYVVIGGGNVSKIETFPAKCELGDNSNAFVGGFRMWGKTDAP